MNICRITKITQDGKPWGDPPNGPYYPFYIVFADGTTGQANAKTNPPAYKEGDEVGYEVTGATPRGVTKLKIDRRADPAHCRNTTPQDRHPDLEAADPIQTPPSPSKPRNLAGNSPAVPSGAPVQVRGDTIGMAMKAAMDVWLAIHGANGAAWNADAISFVKGVTIQIVGISQGVDRHFNSPEAQDIDNTPF